METLTVWLLLTMSIIRGEPDVVIRGFRTEAACMKELAKEKKRDKRVEIYCTGVEIK